MGLLCAVQLADSEGQSLEEKGAAVEAPDVLRVSPGSWESGEDSLSGEERKLGNAGQLPLFHIVPGASSATTGIGDEEAADPPPAPMCVFQTQQEGGPLTRIIQTSRQGRRHPKGKQGNRFELGLASLAWTA